MSKELVMLRGQLCEDRNRYCRECFIGSPYEAVQNPPNVFRAGANINAQVFFIFDKPNNNDAYRNSTLVPITICDPRPSFGYQPTHKNLVKLLGVFEELGFSSSSNASDPLDSRVVHITNAVKCDKCAITGETGRITIGNGQAKRCVDRFLLRELSIIKPLVLVFFGQAPQVNLIGYSTPVWVAFQASLAGRSYWMMRVPHTSPTSFNTHGGGGDRYKQPFRDLMARAAST